MIIESSILISLVQSVYLDKSTIKDESKICFMEMLVRSKKYDNCLHVFRLVDKVYRFILLVLVGSSFINLAWS